MNSHNISQPLISIVVPVYNAAKYLGETIESVRTQTYQDWELLLVNDGSTDDSVSICRFYCGKDDRIQLIETENLGVCYARNQGILSSKGEYIMFMDADDLLTTDCLQHLKEQMILQSVDIVCGSSQAFKKNKEYVPCVLHKNDKADSVAMLNDVLSGRVIASIWGKLYKKKSIENVLFHHGLLLGEDINFLTRLFLQKRNLKIYRDSHVVYKYRIVKNSLSRSKKNTVAKVKSYVDSMIDIYDNFRDDIPMTCAGLFSKNLIGSVFVYLRELPFFQKSVDERLKRIVSELSPYLTVESYAKPVDVIVNGSPCKINIYFSINQLVTKFNRYKKFICRK